MSNFPTPIAWDQGEPIKALALAERVARKRTNLPYPEQARFDRGQIVVHPETLIEIRHEVATAYSQHPRHRLTALYAYPAPVDAGSSWTLLCYGVPMGDDPALRLDEAVWRYDEKIDLS